jgi:hypothetical protein
MAKPPEAFRGTADTELDDLYAFEGCGYLIIVHTESV